MKSKTGKLSKKGASELVYSTKVGRTCPGCLRAQADCVCKEKHNTVVAAEAAAGDGVVRLHRETKGRKGKGVTLVRGVVLGEAELLKLAKVLKAGCGVGGSVKDGVIGLQTADREKVKGLLEGKGFVVRVAGGVKSGLYDRLIDAGLQQALEQLDEAALKYESGAIDSVDLPDRVGAAVRDWVAEALHGVSDKKRVEAARGISSKILELLESDLGLADSDQRVIGSEPSLLKAVFEPDQKIGVPLTPLNVTTLHTNARGEPAIGKELKAEIDSADRIDVVLAFIRWSGIRDLIDLLEVHCRRGRPLRIVTTVYTNSTEPRALEELEKIGAKIRVSYDTSNTRLHAKSWLFYRETGFSSVYIGSSNLTFSAQATGLEWNVRATQAANPLVIDKFSATFESYWQSEHFKDFDAHEFRQEIRRATERNSIDLTPFDIKPHPFQARILEKLAYERSLGRNTNLVVAATGTGKTVISALDYKALNADAGSPAARLLFVAHRKEILQQSRVTFRHVLRDGAFGELWVGGEVPENYEHVFASVQSLHDNALEKLSPDAFDIVIVDEFHHAEADTYVRLLNHLKPKQLLGLTATPERTDGKDIFRWFDGRIAAELRIWDALEQELLAPFHYYGIADGTDLTSIKWSGGGYQVEDLTNIYTADDLRLSKILEAITQIVAEPMAMKAIGFCVSVAHAEFMARKFSGRGIAAEAVSANTSMRDRAAAIQKLRAGELQILFAVDLFNEGVDLPMLDTLLMLRPTESATVFLQQLGRGLRKSDGKDVLTVLDFVGIQRKEFRFDQRFIKLLGTTRRELEKDIVEDFPRLPAGCQINLDRASSQEILANIRAAIPRNVAVRASELTSIGDVSLREFLHHSMLDVADVYASNNYWTSLRRRAGFVEAGPGDLEKAIGRAIGRLLHLDDAPRIKFLHEVLGRDAVPLVSGLSLQEKARLQMFFLSIFTPNRKDGMTLQSAVQKFWSYPQLRREVREVLEILQSQMEYLTVPIEIEGVPLQVHATYSRQEVLAAIGASTVEKPVPFREGVYWHEETQTNLLFVTLDKSDSGFSPTTRYRDYAISDRLFHWESQSGTSVASPSGRRYIEQRTNGSHVVLFVRERKRDLNGNGAAFFCAGLAIYVSYEGERPIAITWRLRRALPGGRFASFRAAVA